MEKVWHDTALCGSESREYVNMGEIDEAFVERLYAQKERYRSGAQRKYPTERQKKIILDLWGKCRQLDIARAIGVSKGLARRWHKELTEDGTNV